MGSMTCWLLLALCILALFTPHWVLFGGAPHAPYMLQERSLGEAHDPTDPVVSAPQARILCWILTRPKDHITKAIHVQRTWGSRCDKLLMISSVEDPRVGTVALPGVHQGHEKLWTQTQKAIRYIWKHHKDDADWFIKAHEDTYVVVDNLRKFVRDYDPSSPHYFAAKSWFFETTAPSINFGGPGYVLSREAVRRFVDIGLVKGGKCAKEKRLDYNSDEATELGICLRSVGVLPEYSLDKQRRHRFWWVNPLEMFDNIQRNYTQLWNEGPLQASTSVITFHPVRPNQLYVLEYLTHYLTTD